ncbi:Oidioi.mRNA.OKI2018_I69.chr2.g4952.t1.cds [Oikopleura dioica]|uniref:Oidioi.mRNA.OKI2018_I69.chr2.g4952.t1.cds n=1 Tax=Oikopleura dioica TaxID=34765 RepID=A0ABN7SYI9_OIKDI|nr:Oidioi.mRNA.OKI2018_I69.chr2.g4952.t1.cds [Oikopleura dioica]
MPRRKPKNRENQSASEENSCENLLNPENENEEADSRYPGENETFATSEATSIVSNKDLLKFQIDRSAPTRSCSRCSLQFFLTVTFTIFVYISPILFLTLPKFIPQLFETEIPGDYEPISQNFTDIGFQGQLIAIAVKLMILMFATAVYLSSETRIARLPSINLYRLLVSAVSFAVISIFWLFYAFKVIHWNQWDYAPIIVFTSCYVDVLLFLHYLGLVILYLRCKHTVYLLEVTRSTDGDTRYYNAGANSIQATAAYVLQKYYRDFPLYNPALQYRSKSSYRVRSSSFKVYNIDETGENHHPDEEADAKAIITAAARRRDAGQNERYFHDVERERRIRKRRSRLECAVDDAFTVVHRDINSNHSAREVAEELWPTMARSMQKYLRTTRQHQHYTREDVLDHLSFCFRHGIGPRGFLAKYLSPQPSITYPGHLLDNAAWSVSCDEPLLSGIRAGVTFEIIQSDYKLIVTVRKQPTLVLHDEYIDPKSFRFKLDLNQAESPV